MKYSEPLFWEKGSDDHRHQREHRPNIKISSWQNMHIQWLILTFGPYNTEFTLVSKHPWMWPVVFAKPQNYDDTYNKIWLDKSK